MSFYRFAKSTWEEFYTFGKILDYEENLDEEDSESDESD